MKQLIIQIFFSKSAFLIEIDNKEFLSNLPEECASTGEFYHLQLTFICVLGNPSIAFLPKILLELMDFFLDSFKQNYPNTPGDYYFPQIIFSKYHKK